MKQLLVRIPDSLHERLTHYAAEAGRSVNAVVTEILDSTVATDERDRRTRLRARAAASGRLQERQATPISPVRRRRIVASTHGLGPVLDRLLADERERT